MSRPETDELGWLRAAFSETSSVAFDGPEADADRIWSAVRGELSPKEVEALVDLAGRSPETAAAWRVAVGLSRELDESHDSSVVRIDRRRPIRWAIGLAAAAAILIGVAVPLYNSFAPSSAPVMRAAEELGIESELGSVQVLPRGDFVLRWTSPEEGSVFELVVTDSELRILHQAAYLETPNHRVPETALTGLAEEDEVWWKIDATRPDGSRVSSPTFVTKVK